MPDEPVSDTWLKAIGGKRDKHGGDYSFFGQDDPRRALLMVRVDGKGNVSLHLIGSDSQPQLHHWLGPRSRTDIVSLLRILGTKLKKPKQAAP